MSVAVAHILPWTSIGGTEHATVRIAKAVAADGYRSIFFYPENASPALIAFLSEAGEAVPYSPPELSFKRPWVYAAKSRSLAAQLRRHDVRIVHCADVLAAQYAALAGKLAGCKIICHVRNRHDRLPSRYRFFAPAVAHFLFVSRHTWQLFPIKIGAGRGSVLYDGLPPQTPDPAAAQSVRQEFGIPAGAKLVGMVGRLSVQKDFPTFFRAAAKIGREIPDAWFIAIGDDRSSPQHTAEARQIAQEEGIAGRSVFTGSRNDVMRLMQALDVFVLATHWEGLPLVILEAMSVARPVVATEVDGVPEIVVPNRTGLLHRHADAEDLAAKVLELLRDPEAANRLGQAACEFVRAEFSEQKFREALRVAYGAVLPQPQSPS